MAFLKYQFLIFSLLCFFNAIFMISSRCKCNAETLSNVSAIFAFGDSGLDTGNNNYLPTHFRADYRPYGINFPGGIPTGRFSNGKLTTDMIASSLGIGDTLPPFLQPNLSEDQLRKGVCFASAAAGLDDQTNAFSGQINVSKQPDYLAAYIEKLKKIVGEDEARRIVREALVIINAGTNDFMYNYYILPSSRVLQYSVTQYQDLLLKNLQILIKKLYDLGCRRITVSGLLPLGCMPVVMTINSPLRRTCLEKVNSDAQIYNAKLVNLLPELQQELPGSILAYGDAYTPLMELITNPKRHGLEETARGCCGTGLIEYGQLCNPVTPVCESPDKYVFWDVVHSTERAYRYVNDYMIKQIASKLNFKV